MGKAKVVMRSSLDNIDVGDFRIDGLKQGETVELPRWVAEELSSLSLAELAEEPFETEIFRAIGKEKMMGPLQLSALPQDFYLRMKRRLSLLGRAATDGKAKKEDLDRLKAGSYDLIGMRLSKLLSLSSSSTSVTSLADKLTPEESAFFTASQSVSKEWRAALLGVT
ncbi:MAG: hypothetical protein OK438_02430 [Thaumarchaeota archaeon]|nr:hypothetical protein [Nitrososphaerota archaeon]